MKSHPLIIYLGLLLTTYLFSCDIKFQPERLPYADFEILSGDTCKVPCQIVLKIDYANTFADSLVLQIGEDTTISNPINKSNLRIDFPFMAGFVYPRKVTIALTAYRGDETPSVYSKEVLIEGPNLDWKCGEVWKDERDGIEYETRRVESIGQCWFGSNLRYGEPIDKSIFPTDPSLPNRKPQFYWPNNEESNAGQGGLYIAKEVSLNGDNLCPAGWRISTDRDWIMLEKAIGIKEGVLIQNSRFSNGWRGDEASESALQSAIDTEMVPGFSSDPSMPCPCTPCELFPTGGTLLTIWTDTLGDLSNDCSVVFRRINFNMTQKMDTGIFRGFQVDRYLNANIRCVRALER